MPCQVLTKHLIHVSFNSAKLGHVTLPFMDEETEALRS